MFPACAIRAHAHAKHAQDLASPGRGTSPPLAHAGPVRHDAWVTGELDAWCDDDDDGEWNVVDVEPARLAAEAVLAGPLVAAHVQTALLGLRQRRTAKLRRQVAEVAAALIERFGVGRRLLVEELVRFFEGSAAFAAAFEDRELRSGGDPRAGAAMHPALGAPQAFDLPALVTRPELAAWLGLHDDELEALCTVRRDGHGRDYVQRWVPRRRSPPRLLEVPKPRLREIQQRLLRDLCGRVPVHPAACAFVRGRSVLDAAEPHVGRACVLRLDLEDCFASFGRGRVRRVFVNLGYPEPVADALSALCTTRCPPSALGPLRPDVAARWPSGRVARLRRKLACPHLPQGSPTSPSLANLCAVPIDRRLAGLARRFGATYTRYADDLVFSGDERFAREAGRLAIRAAAILLENGLDVAHHKTRVMRRGRAQMVCGLVVNERTALPRRLRERLEAILHNCVVHGPSTQNREGVADFRAHLGGLVAWARHFDRSGRLQALFGRIDWSR